MSIKVTKTIKNCSQCENYGEMNVPGGGWRDIEWCELSIKVYKNQFHIIPSFSVIPKNCPLRG